MHMKYMTITGKVTHGLSSSTLGKHLGMLFESGLYSF